MDNVADRQRLAFKINCFVRHVERSGTSGLTHANLVDFRESHGRISPFGRHDKDLQLLGNGSGNVTLSGQAESFTLTLRGSGNLNAGKFSVETAQVKLSGSGNVTYAGSPSLTKSISGSGEIRRAN